MEALMRAQASRDLGETDEILEIGDVDWLRASGAVAQRHPTAIALWRLVELGDKKAFHGAWSGMMREAVMLDIESPAMAVSAVLSFLLDPVCKSCHGRGFGTIPGTPILSDSPCPDCAGTGKRDPSWSDEQKALNERLLGLQREAAAALMRKLR